MCGIAGIVLAQGNEVNAQLIRDMNQALFHRGPDEGGVYLGEGVGLGHRRLSIIDVASGQQPMLSDDQRACIVFNGEIYNHQALRQELIELGHHFNTVCDTEVILQGWLAWGPQVVNRLRGMFAFAIWDQSQQQLFLARDRLGIKPLYYAMLASGELIFGSELKALQVHPKLPTELNPQAISDYFSLGYIPEPKTIFEQVYKLRPGHTLLLKQGMTSLPSSECYWDVSFAPPASAETDASKSIAQQLTERLREAVDIRLVAEVPLGAFLSGGVDSSAVVAMMAQLQAEPVNTCAIGFDVADFNETEFAAMVAQRYQTAHRVATVASDDFALIDKLAYFYDEPFADSSAMPTYRVCELAKQQVTVALSGDGGDELFAGYRRYQWHLREERIRSLVPEAARKPVFSLLAKAYPKADWAPKFLRAKTTFQAIARDTVEGYFHNFSIFSEAQKSELFSEQLKAQLGDYRSISVFNEHYANFDGVDSLSLVQYLDLKTYLPGDILTKVDRVSMAHALEVRVPILDHKLVEWSATLPPATKLAKGVSKAILKQALEPHLPEDVLYRRKMGFAVPLCRWFRGPLKDKLHTALSSGCLAQSQLFNLDYIHRLLEQHSSGRRDHSAALWALLMFEAFLAKQQAGAVSQPDSVTASAVI
ncbi:XrtA/PEP-CTERM system amidotransferase [Motilimonas eburnea]|uniref:XrtA/PEP-CTERM system amidotransferase n=1 Tax=Motilimonas eburnea TaxID=1737488 RepID=UPI001E47B83A|nr:XrtA/PEP-CTERM system amidotransferase [Motilimonas eburnea]MCE2572191.1 amidotransferase 1, exosortase A system-associated [Motilimonas eburnea]